MERPREKSPQQLGKVDDVMRLLSLSRAKVYELMESGQLRWVKIGKSRRIVLDSVQALIERNSMGA